MPNDHRLPASGATRPLLGPVDPPRRRAADVRGASAWWRAVLVAGLLCAALAATVPAPARAQLVGAGILLTCVGVLMRHRLWSDRRRRPNGAQRAPRRASSGGR